MATALSPATLAELPVPTAGTLTFASSVESFFGAILAPLYGLTGTLDPFTKQAVINTAQAGVTQALGPGADPTDVAAAQNAQAGTISDFLTSINADPSQAVGNVGTTLTGVVNDVSNIFSPGSWSLTTWLVLGALLLLLFVGFGVKDRVATI